MWFKGKKTAKEKGKKLFPSFANSMGQRCWQSWAFFQQNMPAFPTGFLCQRLCPVALPIARTNCWQSHDVEFVAKRAVTLLAKPSPTAVAVLLAKGTATELTASSFRQQITWLLVKLSQQGSCSCWQRALSHHLKRQWCLPNRNGLTLLGKLSPTG
jgi:hypothetical protein